MHRRVNTSDLEEVASAFGPATKLVWLESPTNPRLQISDIRVSCFLLQSFYKMEVFCLYVFFWAVIRHKHLQNKR